MRACARVRLHSQATAGKSQKSKQNKPVQGKAKFSSHRIRAVASFPPLPQLLKQLRCRLLGKRGPRTRGKTAASLGVAIWPRVFLSVGVGREDSRECPPCCAPVGEWAKLPPCALGKEGKWVGREVGPACRGERLTWGRGHGQSIPQAAGGWRGHTEGNPQREIGSWELVFWFFLFIEAGSCILLKEGSRGEFLHPSSVGAVKSSPLLTYHPLQ